MGDVDRTNNALRKTAINMCRKAGMSLIDIQRRSRHKSLEALQQYMGQDSEDDLYLGMSVHAALAGENLTVDQLRTAGQAITQRTIELDATSTNSDLS